MSFGEMFPATSWLWRRASSRLACRLYFAILALVCVPAIAFRMEAALFQRSVLKATSALSSLRIAVTSQTDALPRVAGLNLDRQSSSISNCEAEECVSISTQGSWLCRHVLVPLGGGGHQTLFAILSRWGIRCRSFEGHINFNSGMVSGIGYRLWISTDHADIPGAIIIDVSSKKRIAHWEFSPEADESPYYQVRPAWKWPDLVTGITFSADAPTELVSHAFDLKLGCVWSLTGCRSAKELLPKAEQDQRRIEQAAIDRMKGANQCPDWILPQRALYTKDISLLKVIEVSPTLVQDNSGLKYRFASFRLLRKLKGNLDLSLDNIGVSAEVWFGQQAHNSSIDLLNPGQKLILFGESPYINRPCQAVAGTESAIRSVEEILSNTTL